MHNVIGRLAFVMLLVLALPAVAEEVARAPSTSAAFVDTAFLEANEQYRAGRYEAAAEGYRALLEGGVEHPALYFNLGNAWMKNGRLGEAVWAYLKAQVFMPRDVDLQANLDYARSLLSEGDAVSVHPPRVVRWMTLNGRCSTAELVMTWTALWWGMVSVWIVWTWGRRARPWLGPVAWGVSAAAVLTLTALVAQTVWVDAVPKVVAVTERAEVKFAPQPEGIVHLTLPEGAVVRLQQRQDGWIQIRRVDGRAGWVRADAVKLL